MIRQAARCPTQHPGLRLAWLLAGCVLSAGSIAHGQVVMRLVQAGFVKDGQSAYREGCWTPITVELQQGEGTPFSGTLQIVQPDRDGDQAASELPVALTPGAPPRRYTLYTVPRLVRGQSELTVRLVDDRGRQACGPVQVQQGWQISPRSICLLDLSDRPLPGLREVESVTEWVQPIMVCHLSAHLLPRRWFGLESADVILWDEPGLDRLDADQVRALAEWVRGGGTLVLGLGTGCQALVASALGEDLPIVITPGASAPDTAPFIEHFKRLLDVSRGESVAAGTAVNLVSWRLKSGGQRIIANTDLFVRGRAGWGRIVVCAAPLREFVDQLRGLGTDDKPWTDLQQQAYPVFYELLIGLHMEPPSDQEKQAWSMGWTAGDYDLYAYAKSAVGMQATGGLFFLFASLFVIAYVLLATLGLWAWLKRRQWSHHNWSAFAACAVVASLLGVVAVQVLRGARMQVHELAVIDGVANSVQARATGYFGLRTPWFTRLDVDWPRSNLDGADAEMPEVNFLRPMPTATLGFGANESAYMAPQRYLLQELRAGVARMPVRATLKQLQGYWAGELQGVLRADLAIDAGFLPTEESWIRNDLGVDLTGCWLILCFTDDLGSELPGAHDRRRRYMRAYCLGTLRDGERLDNLPRFLKQVYGGKDRFSPANEEVQAEWVQDRLASELATPAIWKVGQWQSRPFERALWLLTTYAEYDTKRPTGGRGPELLRSHGRRLDRSALLDRQTALLIGFASAPGPSQLRIGGRRPVPSWACSAYRFVIPVRRPKTRASGDHA